MFTNIAAGGLHLQHDHANASTLPVSHTRPVDSLPSPRLNNDSNIQASSTKGTKRKLDQEKTAAGLTQLELREEVKKLQQDDTLDVTEKSKRMQELMTRSWRKCQDQKRKRKSLDACCDANKGKRKKRKSTPGYKNYKSEDVYGCSHYERGCNISAPCCDTFFACRFCHDESSDHHIDRYAVDRVQCMKCGKAQDVAEKCIDCGFQFARYFCEPCKFYDNAEDKDIYHCHDCGLCRIGKGLGIDFFHCHRCKACMSLSLKEHTCVERSLESDCPVCHEFMFTSIRPVCFLPCGHCMHADCYTEYTNTNYVCPICSKSIADMSSYFKQIDKALEKDKMPKSMQGLKNLIFCADCEKRSEAPVHFLYHKCKLCNSYNTKVLERLPQKSKIEKENNATTVN